MTTVCFGVLRGKRVRVTQLNTCSVPVTGNSYVVSSGFIQVTLSAEVEGGDEYIQKNADGALCINERAPDSLKRLSIAIDWCKVDPDIISIITGNPLEMSGADAVGFRIEEGLADARWGLDLWSGLSDQDCAAGEQYGYLLVPNITGSTLGDIQIQNGTTTFTSNGYTEHNSGWGVGPYDVIGSPAGPLDVAISSVQHALLRTTVVAPPAAVCGAQTL